MDPTLRLVPGSCYSDVFKIDFVLFPIGGKRLFEKGFKKERLMSGRHQPFLLIDH